MQPKALKISFCIDLLCENCGEEITWDEDTVLAQLRGTSLDVWHLKCDPRMERPFTFEEKP